MNFTTRVCILKCFKYLIKGPLSYNPFCLICLCGVYRPTREFFTHMETSPLPVKGCKFDLYSALMAFEQWGLFNVSHLLCHGSTLYNDHLRGPVTLTPVAERLAVELSLPVFTTHVCRDRGSNLDLPHASPCFWTHDYSYMCNKIFTKFNI